MIVIITITETASSSFNIVILVIIIAGYLQGSGPHVLVLAPVAKGGCGVNHIGGTHELLHILGLAHVQNRADRCNYIDVNIDTIKNWGEWRVSQLTGAADWFSLRVPYDCSSTVHYYQLQGAFWKDDIGMDCSSLSQILIVIFFSDIEKIKLNNAYREKG